ncbi:PaaI family thioesterase [bacterium]|nr:PaaI family thioesterase [bacterium]
MTIEIFEPIKNDFNSVCFGCSPNNPTGLKMQFKAGTDSVISDLIVPGHLCGWSQLIHGGVLTTILDEVMSWAAMHFLKQLVMTKTLNLTFLKPVYVGKQIRAIGKIKDGTGRHEVIMEGIVLNDKGQECVKSDSVFAILKPKIANRLGITQDELPTWFEDSKN